MAQLKASISQQMLNDLLRQMQDFVKKVESEDINLKFNENGLQNQLDELKHKLQNITSNIKPIDIPLNVDQTKKEIADIEGSFDQVISKFNDFGKVINIQPKYDSNGSMKSFILQLEEASGIIDKINLKSGFQSNGADGTVSPNGQFTVQSIDANNKILQIEQQKSREIEKQNADREKALQYEQQVRQALQDEEAKQEQITQKLQQQVQNWQESKNIQMQRLQQSNQEAMKNTEIQQQYKTMQETIANMGKDSTGNFDKNFDTSKLTEANNQFKQLGANVNGINQEVKNTHGSMGGLLQDFTKMGQMAITGGAIYSIINGFKESIGYVDSLNKSLVNIEMVTDMSAQKASGLVEQYRQLANAMGQNDTDFLQGAENYLRAGLSDSDTNTMLKQTAMASAISGESNSEMSDSLLAMKNAYGLTADEVGTLVDKISTLDSKSSSSFSSIAEGMKRSSANAKEVGIEYDKLASYIATVQDITHKSATTIGENFKSIFSRMTSVKAGASDADGMGINDVEKVLDQQNIKLRATSGEWRNMGDVISDISSRWNEFNGVTRSQIANAIAGKEQASTFLTLMQNTTKERQLEADATNSQGSAEQKYATYLTSSEAKANQLKDSLHNMWSSMVNSSEINGAITVLTNFTKTFGNLPEILSVATTAFLMFKGQAISGLVSDLMAVIAGESATTVATVGLTSAFNALKIAFATNPLGMIALGATAVITAFELVKNNTQNEIDKLDEMSQKVKQTQSDIDGLKDQSQTLNDLNNKTALTTDEKTKLKDVNNDLADKYPELISWYDKENGTFNVSIDKLNELIKKKQELAMQENANGLDEAQNARDNAQKAIDDANSQLKSGQTFKYITEPGKPGRMGTADLDTEDRQKLFDTISKNQSIVDKSNQSINQSVKYINDYTSAQQKAGQTTDEISKALQGYGYSQSQINNAVKMGTAVNNTSGDSARDLINQYNSLRSSGDKSADTQNKLSNVTTELKRKYDDLDVGVDGAGNSIIKNTNVLTQHANALKKDGQVTDDTTDKIKTFEQVESDLGDSVSKARTNISNINKVLDEHAKSGEWNYSTILSMTKAYPNLLNAIGNDKALTQELTNAKQQETNTAEDGLNQQISMLKNEVNQALNMYGLDISNFADAQSAKTALADAESKKRISILEKELQVQANASDAIAKDSNGKVTGRGARTPYDEALQKLNQAKADLANDQSNVDEYFNLQALKKKADSLLANVGDDDYNGTKNKTPANTQASQALTAQSRDVANQNRDIAIQSRNLDMQNQQLENQSKALDAQSKALDLKKQQTDTAMDNAYKAEQQQQDAIIKGYQKQLDQLKEKKQLQDDNTELLKTQNDLIKAQQEMQNAQNEKNVRIYENGQWVWSADQVAVDKARDALAEAQQSYNQKQADIAEQAQEKALNDKIQATQDAKDAYATNYQNKKDAFDQDIQNQQNAIQSQKDSVSSRQQDIQNQKSNLDNSKNDIANQQNNINDSRNSLAGYASGTDNADSGIKQISEDGIEIVIGNQLRQFQGGEVVLNNTNTQKLLQGNSNSNSNNAVNDTKDALNKVGQAINDNKNLVKNPTNQLLNEVDDKVQQFVDQSSKYSHDTNENMGKSITNNKQLIKNPMDNLINEIKNQLQQYVDGSGQYGKNSNNNIGGGITNNSESVYNPTRTLVGNVKGLITTFVASTNSDGKNVGVQLGQGVTDSQDDLNKNVETLCTKMIDKFHEKLGIHSPSTVMHEIGGFMIQGLINGMNEADIEKFITDKIGGMTGAINGQVVAVPGNVSDWLTQAMKITGVDASWLPALEMIASRESGNPGTLGSGNPTLRNSVGVGGEFATGLMQTLPSTFESYAMANHGNILNPIDNAIASINYIKDRYKTPYAIKNWSNSNYVGYQTGTDSATPGMHPIAENGFELVIGNQLKQFQGGETVLSHDKTMNMLQSLMPQFNMPDWSNMIIPKGDNITKHETNINVANVEMPSGIDAEGFVDKLRGLSHVTY